MTSTNGDNDPRLGKNDQALGLEEFISQYDCDLDNEDDVREDTYNLPGNEEGATPETTPTSTDQAQGVLDRFKPRGPSNRPVQSPPPQPPQPSSVTSGGGTAQPQQPAGR
ncbi:hypothetical protein DENSPDRAFT_838207 [Dentipellis sp. KUC8613]|nr:hypothetical protein DENSPDRAFT_838207 [Dentipellis sp. KUC8613]